MNKKIDSDALYNKIAGCLLAGALGDALGYEVEFDSWDTIQRRFGKKGIQNLCPEDGQAVFSDDTQMTLFTLEGMLLGYWRANEKGVGANVEVYVWQDYLSWLKTQSIEPQNQIYHFDSVSELLRQPRMHAWRAPGNTCLSALKSGEMGTMQKPLNHSKGCGGVMRTAPLGFMECWGNPVKTGAKCAAITHGHPLGFIPAGILSGIVHYCIYENDPHRSLGEIIDIVMLAAKNIFPYRKEFGELERLVNKAKRLVRMDADDVDAIEDLGGGWTGDEAFAIAVYCALKYEDDIKKALIAASNHSGDSDSTAVICGNILGAYLGMDALDMKWVYQLEMHTVIMEYAAKAVQTILHREYRLEEESEAENARADHFMNGYAALTDVLCHDTESCRRVMNCVIGENENDDYLKEFLFHNFYKDLCHLHNNTYFAGEPYNPYMPKKEASPAAVLKTKRLEIIKKLLETIDDESSHDGSLMCKAIAQGKASTLIREYLSLKEEPVPAVSLTEKTQDILDKKRCDCLDEEHIWFLTTYYDDHGAVRMYSLDEELASDSHYEFTDEKAIREKIYQEGDEKLRLDEILRRYTLENGGAAVLRLIWPYITAQFHYD